MPHQRARATRRPPSLYCIRGNHEELLLAARFNPVYQSVWERNGGDWADDLSPSRLAELAAGLPEELHEVWALADVQHLSMQEIVELTGLHLANVKTRLHRARLLLRERLGAELGRRG